MLRVHENAVRLVGLVMPLVREIERVDPDLARQLREGSAAVGVCYDADRLNLWRMGIRPERKYLSTKAGISMAGESAIQTLHYDPLTWGTVLDELRLN